MALAPMASISEETKAALEKADIFNPDDAHFITQEFKYRHPTVKGLNISQQKDILLGVLTMVRIKGKNNKFQLWKTADIKAGKLAERNREIQEHNAEVRRQQREAKIAAWNAMSPQQRQIFEDIEAINKHFKFKRR